MKFSAAWLSLILFGTLLVLVCLSTASHIEPDAAEATPSLIDHELAKNNSPHSKLKLSKVLNFQAFKKLFKKSYKSVAEEVRRSKIFLAKQIRAIISVIRYKWRIASSYLRINHMSDWTREEIQQTYVPSAILNSQPDVPIEKIHIEDVIRLTSESKLIQNKLGSTQNMRWKRDLYSNEVSDNLVNLDGVAVSKDNFTGQQSDSDDEEFLSRSSTFPLDGFHDYLSNARSTLVDYFNNPWKRELDDNVLHIDLRESGCLFKPRNQYKCGSCYAFGSIALLEYEYCIRTGKKVAFSEQFVIDCGIPRGIPGLDGCNGGDTFAMPQFVGNYGLEYRRSYPYKAVNNECPYNMTKEIHHSRASLNSTGIQCYDTDDKFEFLLFEGPALVNFDLDINFHQYGGGVATMKNCNPAAGHTMLFVGSGREDGQDYWLFRNSYSADWGEAGHYKLSQNSTDCIYKKRGCRYVDIQVGQGDQ